MNGYASSAAQQTLISILPDINYQASGIDRKPTIQFSGANLQVINGTGSESVTNGEGNLVIGYNESPRTQTGSHNLLLGGPDLSDTNTSYGGIVAGTSNTISGPETSILGGDTNTAHGALSTITGGEFNLASDWSSTIGGGFDNLTGPRAAPSWSCNGIGLETVTGGAANAATGYASSISGGTSNTTSGPGSSARGGWQNTASGESSWVGGGHSNHTVGYAGSISGGASNLVSSGSFGSILGGFGNGVSSNCGTFPATARAAKQDRQAAGRHDGGPPIPGGEASRRLLIARRGRQHPPV